MSHGFQHCFGEEIPPAAKAVTTQGRDEMSEELKRLRTENKQLEDALRLLIQAVQTHMLCGIPEIKTVDDVIRGMRTVADKLGKVCATPSVIDGVSSNVEGVEAEAMAREAAESFARAYHKVPRHIGVPHGCTNATKVIYVMAFEHFLTAIRRAKAVGQVHDKQALGKPWGA